MSDLAGEVAAAAEQQGQASQDIARAITRAAREAGTVSESVADLRAAAVSTETEAGQVRGEAARVGDGTAGLRAAIDAFLVRIHTA